MLKEMQAKHVEQVVQIHHSSWSADELSVKLGPGYLKAFYSSIVHSPYSFGYVYLKDNVIVGYATGFTDYEQFNSYLRSRSAITVASSLVGKAISGKVKVADVRNMFSDSKKLRRLSFPQFHLGALALHNDFKGTPVGKEAIGAVIQAVIVYIKDLGAGGCWGACDDENIPMKKYLWKLGFDDVDEVEFIGREVVVFEKTFEADGS